MDRKHRSARAQVLEGATRCYWCGCEISDDLPMGHPQKAVADHVIPRAEGGQNVVENYVPACWTCNAQRGKKGLDWRPGTLVDEQAEDW